VIEIQGSRDGPTLAVVAGVHGSEYPGIEAAIRLGHEVRPEALCGCLRIVPIHNVPAFYGRAEAVCPYDGKNPNRVFPGNPDGTYTDVMNHLTFTQVIQGADAVINVHGGDIFEALVPYCGTGEASSEAVAERSRQMGLTYGVPYLVRFASRPSVSYGEDLTTACAMRGIPAILAEAGGNGLLSEEAVQVHLRGFRNVLKTLEMIDGQPEQDAATREALSTFWRVEKEGVFYPSVELGQKVREGDSIGVLKDWFGGDVETLRAPHDAAVIAIVTTPAARAGAIVYQVAF
jgi:predicted deacylase